MKSHFYKVWIEGTNRDVTDLVGSLTFEDCKKEDDFLRITIKKGFLETADDPDLISGKYLLFQFGYLGGLTSPIRRARIADVNVTYAQTIDFTISALDQGTVLKKNASSQVWNNLTAAEIAREIARRHNLTAEVQETKVKLKTKAQGNRSDFEFLAQLATESKMLFRIHDDTLYFTARNLAKPSKRTYTYGYSGGPVKAFRVSMKESMQTGASADTQAISMDPLTKQPVKTDGSSGDVQLGKNKVNFDVNGNKVPQPLGMGSANKNAGKIITHPDPSKAKNVAATVQAKAERAALTATLELEGDPTLVSEDIITMGGVAKRHSGNWEIEKVTHTLGGSYTCSVELSKDATGAPVSAAASTKEGGTVNNSKGADKAEKKVKLRHYDENGKAK